MRALSPRNRNLKTFVLIIALIRTVIYSCYSYWFPIRNCLKCICVQPYPSLRQYNASYRICLIINIICAVRCCRCWLCFRNRIINTYRVPIFRTVLYRDRCRICTCADRLCFEQASFWIWIHYIRLIHNYWWTCYYGRLRASIIFHIAFRSFKLICTKSWATYITAYFNLMRICIRCYCMLTVPVCTACLFTVIRCRNYSSHVPCIILTAAWIHQPSVYLLTCKAWCRVSSDCLSPAWCLFLRYAIRW